MPSSIRFALILSPILAAALLLGAAVTPLSPTASRSLPLEWAGAAPTEPAADGFRLAHHD